MADSIRLPVIACNEHYEMNTSMAQSWLLVKASLVLDAAATVPLWVIRRTTMPGSRQ